MLSQALPSVVCLSMDIAFVSKSVVPDHHFFQLSRLQNGPSNFGSSWIYAADTADAADALWPLWPRWYPVLVDEHGRECDGDCFPRGGG